MIRIELEESLPSEAQKEYLQHLCDSSSAFKKLYYFAATLKRLQDAGFIEGYVEISEDFDFLFDIFLSEDFQISDQTVQRILEASPFEPRQYEKITKFYEAFHSDKWENYVDR